MPFKKNDRRKFPIISAILSACFVMAFIGLAFWTASIDSRLRTVATLQTSVLNSNIKFGKQCDGIKIELSKMNDQLNNILPLLISGNTP